LTEPGKTVVTNGVTVDGPLNLASAAPIHASEMYARNLVNLLDLLISDDGLNIDMEDEVVAGTMLTHQGKLVHGQTAKTLGLDNGEN